MDKLHGLEKVLQKNPLNMKDKHKKNRKQQIDENRQL